MKKTILNIAATVFIAGAFLTSCKSEAEKAEKDLNVAQQGLVEAHEDYIEEVNKIRAETAEEVAANKERIAEFRKEIANEKAEAQAEYNVKIAELEKENDEMKKKMDDYKPDGKEKWEAFKTEFGQDMDGLGKSFKDFTVKKTK